MPWQSGSSNEPNEPPTGPAIGISLTDSYGTVSIRYDDGTFKDIARVNGNWRYRRKMQSLAKKTIYEGPKKGDPTREHVKALVWGVCLLPFSAVGLRSSQRLSRNLSPVIAKLYKAASPHVSEARPSVNISYPSLTGLDPFVISDIEDRLKMRRLKNIFELHPDNVVAASAGHGLGLVETYSDYKECNRQQASLPTRQTYFIEYTRRSLVLHSRAMSGTRYPSGFFCAFFFDLGSDEKASHGYADSVRHAIMSMFQLRYDGRPYRDISYRDDNCGRATIIITGESGDDSFLHEITHQVAKELGIDGDFYVDVPEYVASRGVAELAWREKFLKTSVWPIEWD